MYTLPMCVHQQILDLQNVSNATNIRKWWKNGRFMEDASEMLFSEIEIFAVCSYFSLSRSSFARIHKHAVLYSLCLPVSV